MEKRIQQFTERIGSTGELKPWDKIGIESVSLYKLIVDQLLRQAVVPLSSSLDYWDSMLNSGMNGIVIFGVQNIFRLKEWRYMKLRQYMIQCRQQIYEQRNMAAEELGHLVQHMLKKGKNTKATIKADLYTLLSLRSIFIEGFELYDITNISSAERALNDLRTQLSQQIFSQPYRQTLKEYGTPSFIRRYWPIALGGGLCLWKLLGNWKNIVNWFQDQVLETARSAWSNWVVDPLLKVYQTIRHDDNAQVAIMAKHSLDSDMKSLERMVVEFTERYGDNTENSEQVMTRVRQGDISSVLLPYEKQIQTPLKSLVIGSLTQALLIQVQKTKVDVEVAMSGIDKLLQSQQLVFGLVAALPSIGAVWWLSGQITALIKGKSRHIRGRGRLTRRIRAGLGQIQIILSRHDPEQTLDAQDFGLIIALTYFLRYWTKQIISTDELYNQFCNKLDKVEDPESQVKNQLKALEWIYICGFD